MTKETMCSLNDLGISTMPLFLFTCMWADLLICQLWDWYCGSIAKGTCSPVWQPEFKLQDLQVGEDITYSCRLSFDLD